MPEPTISNFSASWGAALKLMTGFFFVLFIIVAGVVFSPLVPLAVWVRLSIIASFPVILIGCAIFVVRGYSIHGNELLIRRLGWSTRFELTKLLYAKADAEAVGGSIRLFGNGGLFAFTGWYRNKKLGVYRAFVTDAKHGVVLRFTDRTVVVSPDEPERFVSEITALIPRQ